MNHRPLVQARIAAIVLVGALAVAGLLPAQSPPPQSPPSGAPSLSTVLVAAAEIGLTPDAVASSGLQASANAMLDRLAQQTELRQAITSKRTALSDAAENLLDLQRQLSLNPASETLHSQAQTASLQVQTLRQEIDAARASLLAAVTLNLSNAGLQRLATFQESQGRRVPPEFRVKHQTPDDWHKIELALIAEGRAQRMNQTLASQHAELLAGIRADVDVIEAAGNLQSHLSDVQSAFAQVAAQAQ